jgi:hypothetical protein
MAGAALAGCNSGPGAGDGGTSGGSMQTYVIGLIQTDPTTAGVPGSTTANAFGFDLDMMHNGMAGTCTDASDFADPYNMSNMNIDNQLSTALPVLGSMLGADGADGAIRDQIESGKILLMLQIGGIDSYTNDTMVSVHAMLGVVRSAACTAHADMASCGGDTANHCAWAANATGGGTCNGAPVASTVCMGHADATSCQADVANACNWSMANSNCTGIMANQTIAMLMDLGTVNGSIANGQLSATTAMLPLHFVAMGHDINLILRSVHFGGHITATNITSGEFGAQVLVDDIVMLATNLGVHVDRTTIEGFVSPDLMPGADTTAACGAHADMTSCTADTANYCTYTGGACHGATAGQHCSAISAGMGYAALQATLGM